MVLEVLILRYYLSLSSLFIILITFIFYNFYIIKHFENTKIISINKGETIDMVINNLFEDRNFFEKKIYYLFFNISNKIYFPINYGKFKIKKNSNFLTILKIISHKSNINYKISIIEGWQKYQLNEYLKNFFINNESIEYQSIISDTYIINSSHSFNEFLEFIKKYKKNFFEKYKNNKIYKKYGEKKILIISSLVEKEAKNYHDKQLITSVIFNRLDKGMKLQIDATVIYAITEGKYKFNKKLLIKDLKYNHNYNTYVINGLPPDMISYVGPETIDIVLSSPKSNFLFYFYNVLEKKHIFSKNFKEHKHQLNDYRKKNK